MFRLEQKIVAVSIIVASIVLVIGATTQVEIFAEEAAEKKYNMADNIEIHTVFTFRDAVEESDGFQVYKQMSGFDRETEPAMFKLEGILSSDRVYLYEAADMAYKRGMSNTNHSYGEFDVDIYLHQEGITFRHFKYIECSVTEYEVDTLFDKEEGWHGKGFAIVDEFEFTCNGYHPNNPLYDLMKTNGYTVKTNSDTVNDLNVNPQTWEDHPKFNYGQN